VNVFLADDSAVFRKSLRDVLEDITGITIIGEADEVSQAIAGIRKTNPDLVLLDIRMPGGSGMDVLRMVNTLIPRPLVFIMTNYAMPGYKKEYLQAGADRFFQKSSDQDTLVEEIAALTEADKNQP